MDNSTWDEIIENYKKACDCFWCSSKIDNWRRDELNGYYYLWTAYHMAKSCNEKNHLWYARILSMMIDELKNSFHEYDLLHKFAEPMLEHYNLALNCGQNPTDKEFVKARRTYRWLKYDVDMHTDNINTYEKSLELISNSEDVKDFEMHDSMPVHFSVADDTVVLKLQNNDLIVTFIFNNVYELKSNTDPKCDYVMDFYCYRRNNKENDLIVFDIGFYIITCESVLVSDIEKVV